MVGLALAGVDPAAHGFRIDGETDGFARGLFEGRLLNHVMVSVFWEPMQKALRRSGAGRAFGLEAFLRWFAEQDLEEMSRPGSASLSARSLYYRLPYPIAEVTRRILFDPLKRSTSTRLRRSLLELIDRSPGGTRKGR
jgi:hypothetical protein